MLKVLDLKGYLGIDCSQTALALAQQARPEWAFQMFTLDESRVEIAPKHFVICFEVLIHQRTAQAYDSLIKFLADHTLQTLIVSGYEHSDSNAQPQPYVVFSRTARNEPPAHRTIQIDKADRRAHERHDLSLRCLKPIRIPRFAFRGHAW